MGTNRDRTLSAPLHPGMFSALLLCLPLSSHAGMTVYGLNDLYRVRLEEISFFLIVLVVSTVLVKWLWNLIAVDIPVLPRLGFKQSAALSLLCGLGMLLILTMISGIREVLTPDAWRRQGNAYRLNQPVVEEERRWHLEQLRDALFQYAKDHQDRFPPHDMVAEIPAKLWISPHHERYRYHYRAGATLGQGDRLVAWEPEGFGAERFAIMNDGSLQRIPSAEQSAETRTSGG